MEYFIKEKMIVSGDQVGINLLDQPDQYNIKILNTEEREMLHTQYEQFINQKLPLLVCQRKSC